MADEKPRWQMRFENFNNAYHLLQEGFDEKPLSQMSLLEKEGLIQRFEYTTELAWKTLKDYLESRNVVFEEITPRAVIREAFAAKVIQDGDIWMQILDDRNKMSHLYDFSIFEKILVRIQDVYLEKLGNLHKHLTNEIQKS